MKEATVIMATCQKSKNTFGIRAEKIGKAWHLTWSFSMNRQAAGREGYDSTTVKGSIVVDPAYPGCPHCKSRGFVHCGNCSKVVCWDGETAKFTCPACGCKGEISVAETFDNIKGGNY